MSKKRFESGSQTGGRTFEKTFAAALRQAPFFVITMAFIGLVLGMGAKRIWRPVNSDSVQHSVHSMQGAAPLRLASLEAGKAASSVDAPSSASSAPYDVARVEHQARARWAKANPVMARATVKAGSYVEVAHLVSKSDWDALSVQHRGMIRRLMLKARVGQVGVMPCFAPGSDLKTVRAFQSASNGLQFFRAGSYWSNTAAGSHVAGAPMTLRWSIVPDGTALPSGAGEATDPSNLKARLNQIYGNEATWRALFRQIFARYTALSGITYIEETNDDGVAITNFNNNPGVAGVRGDVRIGGHNIDGNSGILAYNYFPDVGDMVIDTNDTFFNNTSNQSLGFRNVLAHEHGHGLAFAHVCPTNQTKLMEPFISYNFDGPQADDLQNLQRGYGDPNEPNNSQATATDLGTLGNGSVSRTNISLHNTADQDFFRFNASGAKTLNATLTPVGGSYLEGPQNSDSTCSAGTTFNAGAQRNLKLGVYDSAGTELASVDASGAGGTETLSNVLLNSGAGPFALRVVGDAVEAVQLYSFQITLADAGPAASFITNGSPVVTDNSGNGNNNGKPDPGESSVNLSVPIRNNGTLAATNVNATLVSLSSQVTVLQASSAYPNLAVNATGSNTTPFVISVSGSLACGSSIPLRLDVQSDQGSSPVNFSLTTGSTVQTTFAYAGSPVAIPDGNTLDGSSPGAAVDVPITVSGSGAISDIDLVLNDLPHQRVGDLVITLISPAGTQVRVIETINDGRYLINGPNFRDTVLDDAASTSIQSVNDSQAPYSGSYRPKNPLSDFNGQNANGTWILRVQDFYSGAIGSVRATSLRISTTQCGTPVANVAANWIAGTANYNAAAAWNPAKVPVNVDTTVSNGGTVQITTNQFTNDILAATGANSSGTWLQTAGTVNMSGGWMRIGTASGATGTYTLQGGTLDTAGRFNIGEANGGTGIVNVSGGTLNHTKAGVGQMRIGGGGLGQDSNFSANSGGEGVGTGIFNLSGMGIVNNINELWLGQNAGSTGTLNVSGGTFNQNSWLAIGRTGGTGAVNLSGGSINKSSAGSTNDDNGSAYLYGRNNLGNQVTFAGAGTVTQTGGLFTNTASQSWLGEFAGTTGKWDISAGTANLGPLQVGRYGNGTLLVSGTANLNASALSVGELATSNSSATQSGGAFTLSNGGDSRIGGAGDARDSGATGVYNLSGGTLQINNNLQIGAFGNGTVNQSGGTLNVTGFPSVGRFAGGVGNLNVTGGVFDQTNSNARLIVGELGSGTVSVGGTGTINSYGVTFGQQASTSGGSGTLNLNFGGALLTPFVSKLNGAAPATLNFKGGTLRARAASTNFISGLNAANIADAGAVIDSNGFNITIPQVLAHGGAQSIDGGLTKTGAGTLTLNNASTYTGTTQVNGGTLQLLGNERIADASGLTLRAGSTFNTGGFNETLGVLRVVSNSNLDLGTSGFSVVRFSGKADLSQGDGVLSVLNYQSAAGSGNDQLFIGTSASLSSADLSKIQFINPNGKTGTFPAVQASNGEVMPPPSLPPIVDLNGPNNAGIDNSVTFTEGGVRPFIATTDATVANDPGENISFITATITNLKDGSSESLSASTSGTTISASYTASTGELLLNGPDSVANFQTVLRRIRYSNISQNPNTTPRRIEVIAYDSFGQSQTAVATVNVISVNNAPTALVTNDNNGQPVAQTTSQNTSLTLSSANGNQIGAVDVDDGGNPEEVQVSVQHGTLTLNGTSGLTFSQGDGSDDAAMTFRGTVTIVNNEAAGTVNQALNGIVYTPAANFTGTDTLTLSINDLGNTGTGGPLSSTASLTINVTASAATKGAIISEFRLHGLMGTADEYIELYNTTSAPLNIGGWSLDYDTAPVGGTVIPSNTVLPARGHYLLAGSAYSLGGLAASDKTLDADIGDSSGVALRNAVGTTVDAAGFAASSAARREGSGIPLAPNTDGEYAFVRDESNGASQDTGDNAADFNFVSTNAAVYNGLQSQLGAPGPSNLNSPALTSMLTVSGIDPNPNINFSPNRIRTPGATGSNAQFGTLTFRRKITNNTGKTITRLRFRFSRLTTLNSPRYAGGSGTQADLRFLSSSDGTVQSRDNSTTLSYVGTQLETPPTQPLGGGSNSAASGFTTVTLNGGLAPGASQNYQFVFGVEVNGGFVAIFNIEALGS